MVAAQPDPVRGNHLKVIRVPAQHAEIERTATEIHGQQTIPGRARIDVQITRRRRDWLRVENLFADPGVLVGFAKACERQFIAMRIAPLEVDGMTQMRRPEAAVLRLDRLHDAQQ